MRGHIYVQPDNAFKNMDGLVQAGPNDQREMLRDQWMDVSCIGGHDSCAFPTSIMLG
jgi:hypothetical protein